MTPAIVLEWLSASLSGSPEHSIAPWAYWHARCMVLGWGVLVPRRIRVERMHWGVNRPQD